MSGVFMVEAKRIIPFSPPDISELEVTEVADTLRSGWITTGPRTKLLERNLAEWLNVEKCVCLNSQTACAEMALRLMGIGSGDEVIVPAYTYTASASVIDHVGARIVLVDINDNSCEMDYDALENAITDKTKVLILPFPNNPTGAIMTKEELEAIKKNGLIEPIFLRKDINNPFFHIAMLIANKTDYRPLENELRKWLDKIEIPFVIPTETMLRVSECRIKFT